MLSCGFLCNSQLTLVQQQMALCSCSPRRRPPPVVHRIPNKSSYTIRLDRPYNQNRPAKLPAYPAPSPIYPCPPSPLQQQVLPLPAPPALPNPELSNPWTDARDELHVELCNPIGIHPFLDWDITNFPSASILHRAPGIDTIPHFHHSATSPGCTTVQIHYTHPTFSPILARLGPISVYPVGNAADIKVEDIMNAIYYHFQSPITAPEWQAVSWQEREQISTSYRARIKKSFNLSKFDASRGPLRIDALKGCTRFAGLQTTSFLNHSGEMYMKLVPL